MIIFLGLSLACFVFVLGRGPLYLLDSALLSFSLPPLFFFPYIFLLKEYKIFRAGATTHYMCVQHAVQRTPVSAIFKAAVSCIY